jgi:hypothetical protein
MSFRSLVFLAAASVLGATSLLGAACGGAPTPVTPQGDCPKLPNCGQCASQGGCGFCDGQCMAVGSTACASGKWAKSPDQCPMPSATPATPAAPAH